MLFHKAASVIFLCASCAAQAEAGATSAAGYPPVPVPRPAPLANYARDKAQPKARPTGLDQALEAKEPDANKSYRALIKREAAKNGLPPDIADAVAAIESGYDPGAIGGVGEIGLMQVRPETAAMLGFKGDLAELARPEINIHYGVTYLGQAWRLTGGDLCRALMKYRAGHGEEVMSALSMIYCGRARAHLAAAGSPFAATVSVPFVFDPALPVAPAAKRGPRIRTAAVSRAFWAAHEARVKAITKRIEAKWRRLASR
ncbi:MAG: transglycosylase SLT domain-containing protein [Pseudomonadota bacterium]|nr:transglycosylase SLT domain-containing protein [Pseudomonadota bacterium]